LAKRWLAVAGLGIKFIDGHGRWLALGPINPDMKTRYLVIPLIAAALPMAALIAQDSGQNETTQKDEQNSSMTDKDQMMCKSWSQQDTDLDKLVADMNSASSDKKLDAVAAVVAKLVEQRKAAHEQMTKMMCADEKTGMNMCQMMAGMDMKGDGQNESGNQHHH
jgi:hypothetical protein